MLYLNPHPNGLALGCGLILKAERIFRLTHPETKPAIAIRMNDILEERAPTDIR
jgi:hypothetical protein